MMCRLKIGVIAYHYTNFYYVDGPLVHALWPCTLLLLLFSDNTDNDYLILLI